MFKSRRPKIGLALGSGGARGLAHLGVIKILEKNKIPIDFIAGSSIGALVGGFYAAGLSTEEIERIVLSLDWRKVLSVLFEPSFKGGLIGGEKVRSFIYEYVGEKRIENCRMPLAIAATDLKTGEAITLKTGKMTEAIRASVSIPLIFKPVEINGRMLADGGLSAAVPVDMARDMGADIVVAVNLNKHYYDEDWAPGWYDIAHDSLNILQHHLSALNSADADVVINIDAGKTFWYEFADGKNKIDIGEAAAKRALPVLRKIIREESGWTIGRYFDFLKRKK